MQNTRSVHYFCLLAAAILLPFAAATHAASSTVATFDGGSDDGFTGNAFFEASGGNPDGNAHFFVTAFGLSLRTGGVSEPANPGFLGDYSAAGSVAFNFDIQVNSITDFLGNEIPRSIGISLIDRDIVGGSGASGVFFEMGIISSLLTPDWVTFSVTVDDTTASDLPAGWVGFGDEDPNTFEPILPAGATFATVLAGVDEFQVTTFVPGFFFTNANYDVRIDNVSVSAVPLPGALVLFGSALAVLVRRKLS